MFESYLYVPVCTGLQGRRIDSDLKKGISNDSDCCDNFFKEGDDKTYFSHPQ
jgi:hypothetical protein